MQASLKLFSCIMVILLVISLNNGEVFIEFLFFIKHCEDRTATFLFLLVFLKFWLHW